MSTVDSDGNASRPVNLAEYDSVKVNIPEFVPGQYFQGNEKSIIIDAMDKIYGESK
jgi:hypothetical protein